MLYYSKSHQFPKNNLWNNQALQKFLLNNLSFAEMNKLYFFSDPDDINEYRNFIIILN